MPRLTPRQVFEDPHSAWAFLTQQNDDGFEGQHFDRKEAGRPLGGATLGRNALDSVKDLVIKTVSAFANSNVEGGLLVLGIASNGEIAGVDHLTEDQLNSVTNLNTLLRIHAAEVRCFDCQDADGNEKTICLIHSASVPTAICETPEANPRAWVRNGKQSLPMTQEVRDQVRIRKGLLDLDSIVCCPYAPDDLDADVMKEFRRVFHPEVTAEFSDERLLREAGAIVGEPGNYSFTLPGLLFFASNPQRVLAHGYLRLLKFLVPSSEYANRGTPSFDKDFRGPITKQIRDARTFLRETSFFDRLQYRKPDGGFVEQPELPSIAVDEAIVNAVAHRDYHSKNPIYCEHYTDAFVVKNPGRIRQQTVDLPNRFDLGTRSLDSMPHNRRLLEWLRLMKDPDGKAFVQALSEGTKRMAREMVSLGLPPPSVVLPENETILKLESRAEERKAAFLASIKVPKTAFLNVFPLTVQKANGLASSDEVHLRLGEFAKSLRDSLAGHNWYIDRFSFSRIIAHRKGAELPISAEAQKFLRFYPTYCIQIHELFGRAYLSIDYSCQVLNILKMNEVCRYLSVDELIGRGCVAKGNTWRQGKVVTADSEWATVRFFDTEEETKSKSAKLSKSFTCQN